MRHRTIIAVTVALAIVAVGAAPAFAAGTSGHSSLVLVGNDRYYTVDGGIGAAPAAPYGAYPSAPAANSKALTINSAGIYIAPAATKSDESTWTAAYCLQATVNSTFLDPYKQITTTSSVVPNLGLIARLATIGAPNGSQPDPATIPTVLYDGYTPADPDYAKVQASIQKSAVQLAIWYFSDGYVLNTDPAEPHAATNAAMESLVASLVNNAIAAGPVTIPGPTTVTLTPKHIGAESGDIVGPFTVTSSTGNAVVTFSHTHLYSDKAGNTPITSGTSLPSGSQVYASASKNGRIVATVNSVVAAGGVFTFDGSNPQDKQSLLVAAPTALPAKAVASITLASSSSPSSSSTLALTGVDGGATVRELVIALVLVLFGAFVLLMAMRNRRRRVARR